MIPILLISQFQELNYHTEQCLYFFQQYIDGIHQMHYVALEHTERAAVDLSANEERLREREKLSRQLRETLLKTQRVNQLKRENGENRLNFSHDLERAAADKLNNWENQLKKAIAWRNAAEIQWSTTVRDLQCAASALAQAEAELRAAVTALEIKKQQYTIVNTYDSDGNVTGTKRVYADTSAERAAVMSAKRAVDSCMVEYHRAQEAEATARANFDRAIEQVSGSNCAVANAKEAVELTNEQTDRAQGALNRFNEERDALNTMSEILDEMDSTLEAWTQLVDSLSQSLSTLNHCNDTEREHIRRIDFQRDDVESHGYLLRGSLERKTELLQAFDMPLAQK
ncbi:hypothetical protein ACFFLZ_05635 [Photobacterium aphoticum]|uniref:Uncharacterized protein n=1 Tax=Photobacterium aphoticum TaxID=754436 RepID=A0A0J1GQG8_9GAMM|nr:hypothetical protein [Photobacterium aphoticum]KLV01876.1 hypothetical protein ABT58_05540 [Photobacterium aphoticum]PSU60106.1 hypothetical protein C9I90_00300 [Photobacterium aphoticum]GHA33217.1 hypothetical protein GCM10007086_03080 [Photobacterium aphoticum]